MSARARNLLLTTALVAAFEAPVACSLLTDTGDLTGGGDANDAAVLDVRVALDGGAVDAAAADASALDAPAIDYGELVKGDGPVAFYRFKELTGDTAKDEMDRFAGKHVGVIQRGAQGPVGPSGAALRFTKGAGARVTADALAASAASWTGMTMEGWAASELAPSAEGYVFAFHSAGAVDLASLYIDDVAGALKMRSSNVNAPTLTSFIPVAGVYYHLAATFDRNTVSLYVDGKNVLTGAAFPLNPANFVHFGVGCDLAIPDGGTLTGTDCFVGRIAEVAIYDKVLTPERIAAHAAARR